MADIEDQQPTPTAGGDAAPGRASKIKMQHNALTWVLIILLVLLLAGGGYLWWQLNAAKDAQSQLKKDKQQLQQQIDGLKEEAKDLPAEQASDLPEECSYASLATLKENIKAALDSKNTAAFSTYTTDPVKYVLAASEEGGNKTPDQAATALEYTHSATGPWDFNLADATITGYDGGFYTDYFGDHTIVGKAASGMVVAFEVNCDGSKITDIFVAADESLL